MEDAHTHILSLHDDKNAAFFAVYDGHGGAKVAEYAGHHLHERIFSQQAYSKREFQSFFIAFKFGYDLFISAEDNNIPDAMRRGFLEIDEDMLDDDDMKDELAGTTAICVIIKDKKIYCVSSL